MRIAHLSTLHRAGDVRIFHKECRTLVSAGHEVHFVALEPPADSLDGVHLHAFERPSVGFRPARIWQRLARMYRQARDLNAQVYHFHDPELIPVGLLLKRDGARVIYDVHENASQESLTLNPDRPWRGRIKGWCWQLLESLARLALDAFVCATPAIARLFPPARTVTVQNFPLPSEFACGSAEHEMPYRRRPPHLAYVGSIAAWRGIREMVAALERLPDSLDARLLLAGEFASPELRQQVAAQPGWEFVEELGFVPRREVPEVLARARMGLVLFHPSRDHCEAQPNKLFEYMAAGLPVIASDFPLWRSIVAGAGCGLLADPLNPDSIASAIRFLLENPARADLMGQRGRAMVASCYNWEAEGRKLIALYRRLEGHPGQPHPELSNRSGGSTAARRPARTAVRKLSAKSAH